MITEPLKRASLVYWKRGQSYSECQFKHLHIIPREGLPPLKAVTVRYSGEDHILRPEEVYSSYYDMFKEKHREILKALDVETNKAKIARDLNVPYSRVRSVFNEGKELGLCHAKIKETI